MIAAAIDDRRPEHCGPRDERLQSTLTTYLGRVLRHVMVWAESEREKIIKKNKTASSLRTAEVWVADHLRGGEM